MNDEVHAGDSRPVERPLLATGVLQSLIRLVRTLVAIAQTRLELFSTEVQEEIGRAVNVLVWAFVALLTTTLALFFIGLTAILIYWDTHRLLAAFLVTATFLLGALLAISVLLTKLHARPRFLEATLSELSKDVDTLKSKL